MGPVTRGQYQYPNGYVRFYNESGQPVTVEGRPGTDAETHYGLP